MTDSIKRAECPKCRIFFAVEAVGKRCGALYGAGGACDGVLVAAGYVPKEDLDSAWAEVEHQKALRYRDCVAQIAVDAEKWEERASALRGVDDRLAALERHVEDLVRVIAHLHDRLDPTTTQGDE